MTALWIGVMTSLSTIAIGLLGLVLVSQHRNRTEIRLQVSGLKMEMEKAVQRICDDNEKDHREMWARMNHHKHNGGGCVIISD